MDSHIILAAPPEHVARAAATGLSVAQMIYRVGRGYRLFRARSAPVVPGGLMVVDTGGYLGGGPSGALTAEILGECRKHRLRGIVIDAGDSTAGALSALAARLASEGAAEGIRVYVSPRLPHSGDQTIVLVPTALSGGTLMGHLRDALERHGPGRVALEVERVRMDFTLPALEGTGRSLRPSELDALMEQYRPQSFFSKDLYAYYFTYGDKKGTHFVLYDTAASIRRKLQAAAGLGIESAFLYYPHVADIIGQIVP